MRVVLAASIVCLVGCGGAPQQPASSAADTSSLESSSSSTAKEAPAESTTASSTTTASPAATTTTDAKATASHAAAATADSSSGGAGSPPAAFHPSPSTTGALDGKPFSPKLARITGAMLKDGRVPLTVTEQTDCTTAPKPGEGALTLLVTWKDGYKTDLGSLKRTGPKGQREVSFARASANGKMDASSGFKPTGTVTVVTAPMTQGATGKMKIDLQSGDYILAGDLDVQVCVAPK
jgi:hypothetical protein